MRIRNLTFPLLILLISGVTNASAATNVIAANSLGTGATCNAPSSLSSYYDYAFTAGSTGTITQITIQFANSTSNAQFLATKVQIRQQSGSITTGWGPSWSPGPLIGTLNPSSMDANFKATFTGAATISSTGTYWIEPVVSSGTTSLCNEPNAQTTASGWGFVNSGSSWVWNFGTWPNHLSADVFLGVVITTGTITTPTISGGIFKNKISNLTVTANTPGTVTFYANGRKIPKCTAVPTDSSNNAVCAWRPLTTGSFSITAFLAPSDSGITSATSLPVSAVGSKRNTAR